MATNYDTILKYMPFAKGVYGTGPGTAPLSVGAGALPDAEHDHQ
ncbi:hypothetical protein [Cupriavidus oxalaticus]|nr:hypothetical protein [Cupriavidus oxalaticus]